MLSAAEALDRILATMPTLPAERVAAVSATGRVLRQTVVAERDQPPFDRVMMDGIAIAFADVQRGTRTFPIQGTQMAGEPARRLEAAHAIEIMTGAALPPGADCIVPVERINVADGVAVLEDGYDPLERQFIHARASDYAEGDELLKAGRRIAPMDVAVIASAGLADIDVSALPVVRIISTGDELVPAGRAIAPHEIRLSNGPAIVSMLASHGYVRCEQDHVADERAILKERIAAHLEEADVLILSGGVSMGKADYVPEVLASLGVEVVLVCCRHYVIPALAKASRSGAALPEFAALTSDVTFEPDLTCFQPVRLVSNAAGQLLALPVKTNTSGDFAALAGTDGYVELAREQTRFPSGTPVFLHRW